MILLIQDQSKSRYVSAELLRAGGHHVMAAEDSDRALELLAKHHFDLTIADVLMPNLGGIAIAARIRIAWPDMPIILIGNLRSSGAESIIQKPLTVLPAPVDFMALLAATKRMLNRGTLPSTELYPAPTPGITNELHSDGFRGLRRLCAESASVQEISR